MRDALGQRGEAIFTVLMTEFHGPYGPIFRPQFLGDKWPCVDFVIELVVEAGSMTPYFFVQVKTTRQGYRHKDRRLKVQVPKPHVCALARYPAPTYIIGIDEAQEQGYVVSANGEHLTSMSSLATDFPLNRPTREVLWSEVSRFWSAYPHSALTSAFVDPNWR